MHIIGGQDPSKDRSKLTQLQLSLMRRSCYFSGKEEGFYIAYKDRINEKLKKN